MESAARSSGGSVPGARVAPVPPGTTATALGAAAPGGASTAGSGADRADGGSLALPDGSRPPAIGAPRAAELMLMASDEPAAAGCAAQRADRERIHCLLSASLAADPAARDRALRLYDATGSVVGLEPEQLFDGGWRGTIRLVPERPIGPYRRHLVWVADALEEMGTFVTGLEQRAGKPVGYRHGPLELRFFRSVGRTTPSAFANGWTVSYNISGSLHASATAVRETLFHEIFHLNDSAHGHWSETALPSLVQPVIERCTRAGGRLDSRCLAPNAPGTTMVRGGTYYAFQPGNGIGEYAAELAVRYYKEHRVALGLPEPRLAAFKCGPAPNAETWRLLADEFFGGVDLTPPCP